MRGEDSRVLMGSEDEGEGGEGELFFWGRVSLASLL